MKYKHILALDIETSGFSPKNSEILEIGVACLDLKTKEVFTGSTLVRPTKKIPTTATVVHGIAAATYKEEKSMPLPEALMWFTDILTLYPGAVIVAYNMPFEERFLSPALRAEGLDPLNNTRTFCALQRLRADKKTKRKDKQRSKNTLDDALKFYGLASRKEVHRALPDALAALRVAFKQHLRAPLLK